MPSDPLKDLTLIAAVLIQRLRDWIEREKAAIWAGLDFGRLDSERRIDAWERDIAVLEILTLNGRHPDELELTLALRGAWRDLKRRKPGNKRCNSSRPLPDRLPLIAR